MLPWLVISQPGEELKEQLPGLFPRDKWAGRQLGVGASRMFSGETKVTMRVSINVSHHGKGAVGWSGAVAQSRFQTTARHDMEVCGSEESVL